ncbi:MAG TPA: nitrile hydratase subunit beta [Xanthobacteraceae bacterium]|nr:nitrile hydratase subunit beta [Xanthobacteraceae bacterium]
MDGIHDMGGMDGFGPVVPEPNEPVFHAPWEGRVLAMNRAMGAAGAWNIDMSRASRENLPPEVYLTSSYYKRWLLGMENLAVARGLVDRDELAAGRALRPGKPLKRGRLAPADVARVLVRGAFGRPTNTAAKFKIGDRVRARNIHPRTHTRLPRYVRGRLGVVELVHGCHVFPDTVALDQGENPQWLYTVVFEARELWGDDADPTLRVSVDAFEPYLEPA